MTKKVFEIRAEGKLLEYKAAETVNEIRQTFPEECIINIRELTIFDRDKRYIDHGYYSEVGTDTSKKERNRKLLESLKLAINDLYR